jgi:hypothetical protein
MVPSHTEEIAEVTITNTRLGDSGISSIVVHSIVNKPRSQPAYRQTLYTFLPCCPASSSPPVRNKSLVVIPIHIPIHTSDSKQRSPGPAYHEIASRQELPLGQNAGHCLVCQDKKMWQLSRMS